MNRSELEHYLNRIAERMFRHARASVSWHDAAPLRAINDAYAVQLGAAAGLQAAIVRARERGVPWPAIAAVLGVSTELAIARYGEPPVENI